MPDTGSAKTGLVGNCALCLQSGHCLCSQEPPVAGAAAHSNFFCCPDFVVWPSPCSASAVERRGQGSATIQRSFGFNFCLQQALKTAVSPWIYCSATCTAARQWQKKRTDPRAMTFCTTSLTQAQWKKKKKSVSADVHVLAGLSRISTAFFWEKNQQRKKLWWAGAITQTLLHNSGDHFSDQAEKWVGSPVISHSKQRKATVIPQIWSPIADPTKNKLDKHGEEKRILTFLLPTWIKLRVFFLIKLQLFKNI